MALDFSIGIVGGTGALGSAIARALLADGLPPEQLWLSNRSGDAGELAGVHGIHATARNQELAEACDVILLSVPPARAAELALAAGDRLVISVMAGVTLERITRETGAGRVVRAMSSPAAGRGLAYSPWCAGPGVTAEDRARTRQLFEACGLTDEVPDEDQIDRFTAMTGPVPGFVALYADCMVAYALQHGIDPSVAERAIRQLFLAAGILMAEDDASPADEVRTMIDYAGTTAAGLQAMRASPLAAAIAEGLNAAVAKARSMA